MFTQNKINFYENNNKNVDLPISVATKINIL